jgi:hypothetical protein
MTESPRTMTKKKGGLKKIKEMPIQEQKVSPSKVLLS